ncbi:alpha/beta hydrolase [Microbulbifer epialgicus]|uniref:Alpha/beta hydrolase n=1 Tax=Microbulbifer epialgicus TaxID=393907 RepID=A0ABV4P1K0_9GAMM
MKKTLLNLLFPLLLTGFLTGCNPDSINAESGKGRIQPLEFLPALRGDYFKLDSEIVGRPYHIYIRLPEGYNENNQKRYPVVYLLDGDSLFPILATNHLFMQYDDLVPEAIVVGIAYGSFDPEINKRSYDFSTPAANGNPDRGGAEMFLNFLEQELLPTIESRYSADPRQRILFGQSRGGHLVLYTAFTKPDLFKGLIASNPTFLPQKNFFYGKPAIASRDDLTLVITSGSDDRPELRKDAITWQEYWLQQENIPWRIAFKTIAKGTHAANSTDSYRFGIHEIFKEEIARLRRLSIQESNISVQY